MSKIEWTDTTWNPTVGCTRVSTGCKNCYAFESHDRRHKGYPWPNAPEQYAKPFSEVQLMYDRLDAPLRWRKPRRVFVNSMSDLFHEDIPNEFIARVFDVMTKAKRHTFQVLTKRPERMRDFVTIIGNQAGCDSAPPNVWLGVSVENQRHDERIALLLETPSAVRFVSCEPLIGPLDLTKLRRVEFTGSAAHTNTLDWVIVGGESGPLARACDVEWIRGIVRQCRAAAVPLFVKQIGAHPVVFPGPNYERDFAAIFPRSDRRKGGDPSEWPEDLRVREFPNV